MDISRMKKMFAGVAASAIAVTQMGTVAFAAYSDVPAGVWYESAVEAFVDAGYLDSTQTRFRGGDNANRAEFIKLVVELNGGILSTPPAVPSFNDVAPGAWYYGYVEEAAKEGWVKGDGNCYGSSPCYARPAANINRAEAAALIVRAFGLDSTGSAPNFVDVPNGQWYTDPMQTAADHCVIQGDDTTGRARPADFMNRAEMVTMLHRVDMGLTYGVDCSSDPITEPQIIDINSIDSTTIEVEFSVALDEDAAVDASLYMVSGDDEIDVVSVDWIDSMTVELTLDMATEANGDYTLTVEDMMTADGETFSDSMSFSGYTQIEQGDGTLEVSVSSSNPAADTVPQGAVGVVMLSTDLSASCDDDVVISELTVLHEGFGDDNDISGVYASMDGARLTRKRSINDQDQTAILRFQQPLMVDACDTVTLDIVADLTTNAIASAEHNFAIELPSDFQSNARDVDGNFPVRGNTFKVAAVSVGTITWEYRTITPSSVEVGETNRVLGKFQLEANNVEDQTVYSVTLEQNGSTGDGDVTNLRIRRTDGTVLTNTVAQTSGDYATFIFDPPFTILEGNSITLEVVGDIEGGAAETVKFELEETSDLFAVGSLYGYGVNGQLYGSQVGRDNSPAASSVTIDAGQLTLEFDGPTQTAYATDEDNAVLGNLNIIAGEEPVDIQTLFLAIEATGSGGGVITTSQIDERVTGVELYNRRTGQVISASEHDTGNTAITTGSYGVKYYSVDDFVVNGSTEWQVRVDFNEATGGPDTGDLFRVEICADETSCTGMPGSTTTYVIEAEGQSTGDTVSDVRPGSKITSNTQRIASPGLTVTVENIGATETAVRNSKNVSLLRFSARSDEGEDILVTGMSFEADDGSLLNAQNFALWVDTDGDTTVDTVLEDGVPAESDAVAFSDLAGGGYVIPEEETVIFEVHADVASSLQVDNQLQLAFKDADGDIEAEEVDDGSALTTSEITLTETQASKLYTFIDGGNLFVTKDSESVRSRQMLGGTISDSVLRLNFRAEDEDVEVTDIRVAVSGSVMGINSIDRLELFKAGETTAFATATLGGCASGEDLADDVDTFCANVGDDKLIIENGENDVDVIVKARIKTDSTGAQSSSGVIFWTGTGGIVARGVASSTDFIPNDASASTGGEVMIGTNSDAAANADILGNDNMVVLAKLTSIVNAGPASGLVPTGVVPIGQFRFTAASNSNSQNGTNKATLSGVIFNVVASNVQLGTGDQSSTGASDFYIYNTGDSSTKTQCLASVASASGSFTVECKGLDAASINTEIDSGASATFALEANVVDDQITTGNSSLQVSLQDFTDVADTGFGVTGDNNHIHWLDEDTTSYSFYWIEYADTVVNSTSYSS